MFVRSVPNAKANCTSVRLAGTRCARCGTGQWNGLPNCSSIRVEILDWVVKLQLYYRAKVLTSHLVLSVTTTAYFARVRGRDSSRKCCPTCDRHILFVSWKALANRSTLSSILLLCSTQTGQSRVSGAFSGSTCSSTSPIQCFMLQPIWWALEEKADALIRNLTTLTR